MDYIAHDIKAIITTKLDNFYLGSNFISEPSKFKTTKYEPCLIETNESDKLKETNILFCKDNQIEKLLDGSFNIFLTQEEFKTVYNSNIQTINVDKTTLSMFKKKIEEIDKFEKR